MKIDVDEKGNILLEEVFNPVILGTEEGENLAITMRDTGFELDYYTEKISIAFELKGGKLITTDEVLK